MMPHTKRHILTLAASLSLGALCAAPPAASPAAAAQQSAAALRGAQKGVSVGQEQREIGRRLRETPKPKKVKPAPQPPRIKLPPVPPTAPQTLPSGSEWFYEVRFIVPEKSDAFLNALRANIGSLPRTPAVAKGDKSSATARESTLADLLRSGRSSIKGNRLIVRDSLHNGRAVDKATIRSAVTNLLALTVADGFYIATLLEEPATLSDGVLGVKFDPGRIGKVNVSFKNPAPVKSPKAKPAPKVKVAGKGKPGMVVEPTPVVEPEPVAAGLSKNGRYFSHKQISRRFAALESGTPFDYELFYDGIYSVNSHPNLVLNADLKVHSESDTEQHRWRYVDIDLEVEKESLPLWTILDLSNYGTKASDYWEAGLTLQYLNLTQHDDVLTANAKMALDASLYSVAGSYHLPYYYGKGGGLTLYGGYSKLAVDDVVPSIDVDGTGWFVGIQYLANVIDNERHHLALGVGMVHRYIEDQLKIEGVDTDARDVEVAPFSLSAVYSTKPSPNWSGRFYSTLEVLYNKGDFLGTSTDEEVQRLRREAEADYFIIRPQVSLIQTFGGRGVGARGGEGRWVLFLRAAGQWADGSLIPGEQIGMGGNNTVRGYLEREYLGDHGAYANIELRTPMLLNFLSRSFTSETERKERINNPLDRLQFVLFSDVGYTKIDKPLPGEDDSQTLASVGIGFRLAITEHAQLKFDWGFPLKETDETSHSGTGHVNLQIQF